MLHYELKTFWGTYDLRINWNFISQYVKILQQRLWPREHFGRDRARLTVRTISSPMSDNNLGTWKPSIIQEETRTHITYMWKFSSKVPWLRGHFECKKAGPKAKLLNINKDVEPETSRYAEEPVEQILHAWFEPKFNFGKFYPPILKFPHIKRQGGQEHEIQNSNDTRDFNDYPRTTGTNEIQKRMESFVQENRNRLWTQPSEVAIQRDKEGITLRVQSASVDWFFHLLFTYGSHSSISAAWLWKPCRSRKVILVCVKSRDLEVIFT